MGLGVAGTAAAIGAAGSIGSSLIGGQAQSGAVSAAADQARADLQPWRGVGQNALMVTGDLSGANGPAAATAAMGNFYTSPGYQFRLDEGLRNINAGAASQGAFRSGATVKAEEAYGQGLASSEFDSYYNRLFNLSNLGEKAASGQADVSQAEGKQQSSIYGNLGSALGSSIPGLANNPNVVSGINSLFPNYNESGSLPGLTGNAGNYNVPVGG